MKQFFFFHSCINVCVQNGDLFYTKKNIKKNKNNVEKVNGMMFVIQEEYIRWESR